MHDPLIPNESKEYAKKESIEKSGEPIYDIKKTAADSDFSNSQVSSFEDAPSQKTQEKVLNSLETKHWQNTVLDVKLCKTKGEAVSKLDIITEIIVQNSKPSISLFVLAIVFTIPAVVFLVLAINAGWVFLIFAVLFGIIGGSMIRMAIDTDIQRRKKLMKAINEDINISFFERTCTNKQWGEYGSEHTIVAYQLFFGGTNYRVSKEAYDSININDSVVFVRVDGEELSIAYPLKFWDVEGVER